jgi:hypothetical protein
MVVPGRGRPLQCRDSGFRRGRVPRRPGTARPGGGGFPGQCDAPLDATGPAPAALQGDHQRCGHEDRRVGPDQDANQEGQCEVGQRVAAEHEQRNQDEHGAQPGVHRAGDGLQAGVVDQRVQRLTAALAQPFADAVEDHHRVVDGVADHGEQRGQEHPVGGPAHERELGGAADHFDGLGGVVDAGQLDDHPPVPRALQGRLGHAELVDPTAQHLEGAVQAVAVDLLARGVGGFEHDLGPAAQVQTKPGGEGEHERGGRAEQRDDGQQPPSETA